MLLKTRFSNDWKIGLKFFQRLEKIPEKVPTIGKTVKKVSNDWKTEFPALFRSQQTTGEGAEGVAIVVAGYIKSVEAERVGFGLI